MTARWKALLVRVGVFAGSVMVALLIVEIGLRIFYWAHTDFDIEMWRYAVELKQPVDDARSHVHVPSRSHHLMDVDVSINARGLRDRDHAYEKTPGRFRVLAVGDSFTLGWGVPVDETFADRLEPLLDVEVVNMGIGNYNTEQELAAFEIEGHRYQPDLVLLFHYINDAEPTQAHRAGFLGRHSYIYAFLAHRLAQGRSWFSERERWLKYYRGWYRGEHGQRHRERLERFARAVRDRGMKLIVVLLPDLRDLGDYPFRAEHAMIIDVMASLGVPAIDLLPAFEGKRSRSLWVAPDDPHPNSEAHDLIARAVAEHPTIRASLP